MILEKLRIQNYKSFSDKTFCFNSYKNIIVGENEAGKSTIIEAIQIVLTGSLSYKNIFYSLNPHLFNKNVVDKYVSDIKAGSNPALPKIEIEAFLRDDKDYVVLKGNNNSLNLNQPGIRLIIEFDENYKLEYQEYIKHKDDIITIPIEYYTVNWYSFSYAAITQRSIPLKIITIDNNNLKNDFSLNNYISRVVDDSLTKEQKASLALEYRKLTENFAISPYIKELNELLDKNDHITDKSIKLTIETDNKNSWERNINLQLDDIPFEHVGSGEKNKIHTMLSIEMDDSDAKIILIEEPENNLSYGNMRKLINNIELKSGGKQLIITTHSPYILNKLGIDSTILLKNGEQFMFNMLSQDTREYFKKLPGYDTLRLILGNKVILVEGPSDELIINKAFQQIHKQLPIDIGVDVICVNGLSFKRFLEVVKFLRMSVKVVTDNDGDISNNITTKYKDFLELPNIKIFYDAKKENYTLEAAILDVNSIETINEILVQKFERKEDILAYMIKNKTQCALKILESPKYITFPKYIMEAINE